MLIRRDLRPDATPVRKDLQELLKRVGGTNPYGESLFRLLRAEDRVTQAAGAWLIWPEYVPMEDRGDLQIQQAQQLVKENQEMLTRMFRVGSPIEDLSRVSKENATIINEFLDDCTKRAPLRVDIGMVDVGLYPYEGWIIEKWKPAHMFGSTADWDAFRFHGQSALGPYPHYGDYEMVAGPSPYMPSAVELQDAVQHNFRDIEDKPFNPAMRVLRMMERKEQARQKQEKDRRAKIKDMADDSPASLHNTLSLGAGRVIQELADKAGMKGHFGA